jgi:micrococcal nuclease
MSYTRPINYPFQVLIVSAIITAILLIGSQSSVQTSITDLIGLNPVKQSVAKFRSLSPDLEIVTINRVIDGDTAITKDGRTIRFLNIDTPETKKPNTPVMCFGPEASQFSKDVLEGREVTLRKDKEDEDKYGRKLRFIFIAGKNTDNIEQSINALLVQKGFARREIIRPNNTFEREFTAWESEAQKNGLGVWKCPKPFVE